MFIIDINQTLSIEQKTYMDINEV